MRGFGSNERWEEHAACHQLRDNRESTTTETAEAAGKLALVYSRRLGRQTSSPDEVTLGHGSRLRRMDASDSHRHLVDDDHEKATCLPDVYYRREISRVWVTYSADKPSGSPASCGMPV